MKKIIVLMSTYNGEKYLKEQIDSILKQKGDFIIDILVRDDGSTDNTINILEEYQNNNKLNWYSGENLKTAKSFMNLIFNVCKDYDYYAFSDQDDYWESNKLQKAIDKLRNGELIPKLYYSNAELVDSNLNSLNKKLYKNDPSVDLYTVVSGANIIGCTIVFNKKLLELLQTGKFPSLIRMHDSYIAMVCVSANGEILYDRNSYIKYRQHGNNVIGTQYTILNKINNRIHDIFTKSKITLDEQVKEILNIYGNNITSDNRKWLENIANYRKNIFTRISFACSTKPKYISKNMAIKYRLSILFGNR